MKILFLHGWHSIPGGVKSSHLAQNGHEVTNPALTDNDWGEAVRTAQAEYDRHRPDMIVGTSPGQTVAMNLDSDSTHWSCSVRPGGAGARPQLSRPVR